jgi:hypothetical protein
MLSGLNSPRIYEMSLQNVELMSHVARLVP